jgi:fibronectin-binding autotransporter adhesin
MKKYFVGAIIALAIAIPAYSHAQDATQSLLNVWKRVSGYVTPTNSTNGIKVPALGSTGNPCLSVGSTGIFATTTCGSGGWGGSSTTTIGGLTPVNGVFLVNGSTTSDTNITISVSTSSPGTINLNPGFTGTLADSRISSAATWNAKQATIGVTAPITLTGVTVGLQGNFGSTNVYTSGYLNASTTLTTSASTTNFGILGVTSCNILNTTGAGTVGCNTFSYLTSVTADSPLAGSGTSGSHLTCATCVTSVTASGNITSSGGTTPAITLNANVLGVTLFSGTTVKASSSTFTTLNASSTISTNATNTGQTFLLGPTAGNLLALNSAGMIIPTTTAFITLGNLSGTAPVTYNSGTGAFGLQSSFGVTSLWATGFVNASTGNFTNLVVNTATTTNFTITGITGCNSTTQGLQTNANGLVSCGTINGTGGAGGATTTINSVNGPNFAFATATSGTTFNIATSSGTVTFNFPSNLGKPATFVVVASDAKDTTRGDYFATSTAQTAINAAITALPTSGGKIYLSDGLFTLSAPIIVNKSNVTIEGSGWNTVIKNGVGMNDYAIKVDDASLRKNLNFKDFKVDGSLLDNSSGGCIAASSTAQSLFDTLWLTSCKQYNLRLTGTTAAAFAYSNVVQNSLFDNASAIGISMENTDENNIHDNTFSDFSAEAIYDNAGTQNIHDNTFVGGAFFSTGMGVYVLSSNTKIINNTFDGLPNAAIKADGSRNTIAQNFISKVATPGIAPIIVRTGSYNQVANNTVTGGSFYPYALDEQATPTNTDVFNNYFQTGTSSQMNLSTGFAFFNNATSTPPAGGYYGGLDGTSNLLFNVPTGKTYIFGVNGVGVATITPTNLSVAGSLTVGNNSGGTSNRLYLAGTDTNHSIYSTGSFGDNMYFNEAGGNFHFVNVSTAADVLSMAAGNVNVATLTPSTLVMTNASKNLQSVTLGTNLSFTGNTLNASGGSGSGTISTSTNLTTNAIPIITAANTIGNSSISQVGGTTLINGVTPIIDGGGDWLMNVIHTSGANFIVQVPTSTAVLGNLVQSGGVQQFNDNTYITAAQFCSGGLFYVASSSNLNIYFPTLTQIGTSPCGNTQPWASSFAQQFANNAGTGSYTINASGSNESLLYAMGSGATIYPGQSQFAQGQFTASTTIQGATSTGMSFKGYLATFQPRSTAPTMQGQFLMASTTATGGNPEWTVGNIIGGANLTVTTTTPGQINLAFSGVLPIANGGTASSTLGTTLVGFTSNDTNVTGSIANNTLTFGWSGNLAYARGGSATTTTFTAGSVLFAGSASYAQNSANFFWDNTNSRLGVGSGTPGSRLTVQGSSGGTQALFTVASSTNATVFNIAASGDILFSGVATSTTAIQIKNPAGQAVLTIDETSIAGSPNSYIINIASSTGTTVFAVTGKGHLTSSLTAPVLTSCGSSPTIAGSDTSGTVTVGSGAVTGCVATFFSAYTNAAHCAVTSQTATSTFAYALSTTAITVTDVNISGKKFDYFCGANGE